jgi:hypothetical protein
MSELSDMAEEEKKRDSKNEYRYRLITELFRIGDNLKEVRKMALLSKEDKMLITDISASVANLYMMLRPKILKFATTNSGNGNFYETFITTMDNCVDYIDDFDVSLADGAFQTLNQFCEESGLLDFERDQDLLR